MKLGELFAGYGGLGMAVEEVFGAELAWVSEWEEAPSKILAHHWPNVPNHGDITKIDWASIEPVDIISGGSPCQDLSLAGKRRGMTEGTRSNLWESMREGIATIKPKYVVWENVRGALSAGAISELEQSEGRVGNDGNPHLRAIGRVLGDLADLGYDAEWRGLTAANVGATHNRFRVFLLAALPDAGGVGLETRRLPSGSVAKASKPADHQSLLQNPDIAARSEWRVAAPGQTQSRGPRADAGGRGGTSFADPVSPRAGIHAIPGGQAWEHPETRSAALVRPGNRKASPKGSESGDSEHCGELKWGEYEPAICRWERVNGPAPRPTEPTGRDNAHRLSPAFVEWMMGLRLGHVTSPAIGISRNDQLKALGNGVVPQQAAAALRDMLTAFESRELAA